MSTQYIYNGFGKYEKGPNGEPGITEHFAGVPFFLPFEKVTPIPDFVLREVDHDKSTGSGDAEAVLTYMSVPVTGELVAAELTDKQIPFKNSEKGIIVLQEPAFTGKNVTVPSGWSEDGTPRYAQVAEVAVSGAEKLIAETVAREYKMAMVQEYLQSKRDRMSGGHGQLRPTGLVKVFMAELGIADIDDVSKAMQQPQAAPQSGLSEEAILKLAEAILAGKQAAAPAPATVQVPEPVEPKKTSAKTAPPKEPQLV